MFSFGNFLKFILVLALAGGTTQAPVISGFVPNFGDGIAASIFAFLILFMLWWFVVSQTISFFSFAFGGGVGRYHTTKLYRRLQWLTFILFTFIPVISLAILFLNLTPFSIETDEYRAQYERVQKERLVAVKRAQLKAIEEAKRQRKYLIAKARAKRENQIIGAIQTRENKIKQAKDKRRAAIETAKAERQAKINKAESKRQAKINQAKQKRQVKQDKIDNDKKLYKAAQKKREKSINAAKEERLKKIKFEEDKREAAYQRAINQRQAKIDDEWGLLEQKKERQLKPERRSVRNITRGFNGNKNFIKGSVKDVQIRGAVSDLALSMASSRGMTIGSAFNQKLMQEVFNYDRYQGWRRSSCSNFDPEKSLICSVIQEIVSIGKGQPSRFVKKSTPQYGRLNFYHSFRIPRAERAEANLRRVEAKIKQIEAAYKAELQRIEAKYRKPLLSDFPEVDLSSFPEIKESDYPIIDKSKFPLAHKPDLPPVDETQFPKVDLSLFPSVDMSKFPAVDLAKFPPIKRSDFPEISEADFPLIDKDDFPLRVDQSPVNIKGGDYMDRLEPTFNRHFWWFLPLVFAGWVRTLLKHQTAFSFLYCKVMRFLDEGRFGFGGSARFASMLEEWGKPYKKNALYVGRSLFNPFNDIGLDGEAHMLTVAGSRGGKGTTAIIPNLLLWEGSAVVIDPKGTNAHVTANARRAMGQDVHIIDPFGIVTEESARFDPLATIKDGDKLVRERITSISDALVIPDANTKDPHWDDGARTIISGLIAQIISQEKHDKKNEDSEGKEESKKEPPKLYEIRDLISQLPPHQDKMWAQMSENITGGGRFAKDAAMRYIRGSQTNEILGLMSNADKHTEWLSSPIMREITSNPTFEISDIKKRPTTIYLVIPPLQLERQSRLLRLFINLVIDAMEQGGRSKIPVLMIMDEFLALGKMPEISGAFATMASYNLTLWPFVQELGKLEGLYGENYNSFIANSRAIQVFAVSDPKTKEYISDRLGSRPLNGLADIAKSNDNLPLRAPNDVELDLATSERRQYIIEAGKPAMLIEKVPYYNSRPISWLKNKKGRFEGKYDPDPDFPKSIKEKKQPHPFFQERWLVQKLKQSRFVRKANVKIRKAIAKHKS
ncbi:MAG: type IV secretory system conjugative DNA transfer family protein [Rhizobiales bacterium]|nr:type IV secretory system conjugative DNA transfer family protein [Hyphomicrobiales bacterium]